MFDSIALPRRSRESLLMRLVAAVVLAITVFAVTGHADDQGYSGQWLIEQSGSGSVHFQLRYNRHDGFWSQNSWSTDAPYASLQGLNPTDISSAAGAKVQFKLVRDAGTFECEGWARNGDASGHWTFVPNAAYAGELKQRGVSAPLPGEQFEMAMSDVSLAFIDELKSQGYALGLSDLIRAGKHGVSLEYVRGMKEAGYRFDDLTALTRMRDHGVTPKYVREMASFGYKNLPAEELRRLRDHGVTGEYLRAMDQAGFKGLSSDEAVRLRDHGVNPEFIAEMSAAGYKGLGASELTRLRDHGVTPEYIRSLAENGLQNLDPAELTRMRDHGVDADYVHDLKAAGVNTSNPRDLVRMRDNNVTASFVREVKEKGYSTDPEELIRLRRRGFEARSMF